MIYTCDEKNIYIYIIDSSIFFYRDFFSFYIIIAVHIDVRMFSHEVDMFACCRST